MDKKTKVLLAKAQLEYHESKKKLDSTNKLSLLATIVSAGFMTVGVTHDISFLVVAAISVLLSSLGVEAQYLSSYHKKSKKYKKLIRLAFNSE